MKAQPYRLATICRDSGILSEGQYDRVMKAVTPKGHSGKSMTDILKSDISKETLLELAFFDVAKPFKRKGNGKDDDGQATLPTGSTVNLQPAEILHILKKTETEVESFKAIISEYEPDLSEDLQQQLAKAKGHDSAAFYQALIQRRIVTPSSLLKIVNDQKHPFFEVNRINLLRQIFELNEVLSISEFNNAYEKAINDSMFFSKAATKLGKFSESKFIANLSEALELPSVDLGSTEVDDRIPQVFPNECVRREIFMVFELNPSHLKVAVTDPLDFGLADMLSVLTCRPVYLYAASENEIIRKINEIYVDVSPLEEVELDEEEPKPKIVDSKEEVIEFADPEEVAIDSMSTVQLVTTILENALQDEATDIHLEPQLEHLRIRYRIDGTLHGITTIPKDMMAPILSRVKVLSNLDVTERRRPQDGNFSMDIHGENVDFRVSTLPTNLGEKIVIRALSEQSVVEGLDKLGLDENQQGIIDRLIQRTYGCILATGPTGSGKTTTLYTAMNLLNHEDKNLVTIEDPVEYRVAGINQVPVNMRAGVSLCQRTSFHFAAGSGRDHGWRNSRSGDSAGLHTRSAYWSPCFFHDAYKYVSRCHFFAVEYGCCELPDRELGCGNYFPAAGAANLQGL